VQLTLLRQGNPLSQPSRQLEILEDQAGHRHTTFADALRTHVLGPLRATSIDVLQINVGKLCNQTCHHCHVDAGPDRRESMSREVAEAVIDVLAQTDIRTLDITGGAPEMNPHFRWLVQEARQLGRRVIDRCNLTILMAPGFTDLPKFLADNQVEIVASLPCYLEENCDAQRGDGVFQRSIEAIRHLNSLGYGHAGSKRTLTLVYNPVGSTLPPQQDKLEADYRRELQVRYDVFFSQLFTITNMPISRFLDQLLSTGKYDEYMQQLIDRFNPAAVEGVMCRTTLSVDWQGRLFDCDFNQMLDMQLGPTLPQNIRQFDAQLLAERAIRTARHCFGCTAGDGSGCQGAVV
jgi:radical SAM/Cys-rich protein